MGNIIDFRLGDESAVVLVSCFASYDGRIVASVEFVLKVVRDNVSSLRALLAVEWKTALTTTGSNTLDRHTFPTRPEYLAECERKIRRVESDSASPAR